MGRGGGRDRLRDDRVLLGNGRCRESCDENGGEKLATHDKSSVLVEQAWLA